jgi:RNA polymerase sigma factor (sigma-70 family)
MQAGVSSVAVGVAEGRRLGVSLFGDERLARLVGQGSERAFVVLYERYHQVLYRYCRSIVGNEADAQDALQSALTNALAALRDGRRDAPLRPWLFRIAHNEAVSVLRRRRPELELAEADGVAGGSVEERVGERERLRLLVEDLGELGERQRAALVMRELSGLSHEEIACALGGSVGATKQAIFQARRALMDCEQGRAMACEEVLRALSDGDRRALGTRRYRAHVRECGSCAAFAAAIAAREADLQALAPPLAPLAAAGLLARMAGGGSSCGSAAGLAAGAAGKSLGAALAMKIAAATAAVTVAALGVSGALHHARSARTSSPGAPASSATKQRKLSGVSAGVLPVHQTGAAGSAAAALKRHRAHHRRERPAGGGFFAGAHPGVAPTTSAPGIAHVPKSVPSTAHGQAPARAGHGSTSRGPVRSRLKPSPAAGRRPTGLGGNRPASPAPAGSPGAAGTSAPPRVPAPASPSPAPTTTTSTSGSPSAPVSAAGSSTLGQRSVSSPPEATNSAVALP